MLYAVNVRTLGALLLDSALRAQQPELCLSLLLRLAPPQHVEGEPRILLGALERTRAEHTLEVRVGLVEFGGERSEPLIAVTASAQPPAERLPLHARGLRALTQRGADTTRADDGRGDLGSEGEGAWHRDDSYYSQHTFDAVSKDSTGLRSVMIRVLTVVRRADYARHRNRMD